jgi:hypothetical protein
MKRVRFLQSYRGVLTAEKWYEPDDETSLSDDAALDLQERGIVGLIGDVAEPDALPLPDSIDDDAIVVVYDLKPTKELRALAKEKGIKGYSRMKRETLIDRLS